MNSFIVLDRKLINTILESTCPLKYALILSHLSIVDIPAQKNTVQITLSSHVSRTSWIASLVAQHWIPDICIPSYLKLDGCITSYPSIINLIEVGITWTEALKMPMLIVTSDIDFDLLGIPSQLLYILSPPDQWWLQLGNYQTYIIETR